MRGKNYYYGYKNLIIMKSSEDTLMKQERLEIKKAGQDISRLVSQFVIYFPEDMPDSDQAHTSTEARNFSIRFSSVSRSMRCPDL